LIFRSKRSEADIIHDILSEMDQGIKKTQLMYKANLSNTQLNRYLDVLLEKEIIDVREFVDDGKQYYLTERGGKVLGDLAEVYRLLNKI